MYGSSPHSESTSVGTRWLKFFVTTLGTKQIRRDSADQDDAMYHVGCVTERLVSVQSAAQRPFAELIGICCMFPCRTPVLANPPPAARNQLGHRIYLPHRLDRGTSGCLLLGFSPEAGKVSHGSSARERPTFFTFGSTSPGSTCQCGSPMTRELLSPTSLSQFLGRLPHTPSQLAQTPSPSCC